MPVRTIQTITDINVGRVYDQRDPEGDVHYETFGRLADFFGRNTPVHRHHSFFQAHVLVSGSIHLNLDGQAYAGRAPALIFTPPTVPHSFYSDEDTDGHVLTIRQEVVRQWRQSMPGQFPDTLLRDPAFIDQTACGGLGAADFSALLQAVELLGKEFFADDRGRSAAMLALGQFFFIHLARLLVLNGQTAPVRSERGQDMHLFLQFCDMVEAHFRDHLTLVDYARRLSITEARLNDLCRRMANQPSKEIVHARLAREARRLLRFTSVPVGEISYQLGFADPAYFSRFFTKRVGQNPSQFRAARP